MASELTADQLAVMHPDDCVCFKLYGRLSCAKGHGHCPFLDPGNRRGDTTQRLKEQAHRYRAAGIKPAFGGEGSGRE